MNCLQCGAVQKEGIIFCTKCGCRMAVGNPRTASQERKPEIPLKTAPVSGQYTGIPACGENRVASTSLKSSKTAKTGKYNLANCIWLFSILALVSLIAGACLFGGDNSGMVSWIVVYMLEVLFWLWVVYFGGAQWLEGSFIVVILLSVLARRWNSDGIKLFTWCIFVFQTIYFVIGLFEPSMR